MLHFNQLQRSIQIAVLWLADRVYVAPSIARWAKMQESQAIVVLTTLRKQTNVIIEANLVKVHSWYFYMNTIVNIKY
jgi:hypothetical protein